MVVGVLITSVSTVLFPNFSTWIAQGKTIKVEKNLRKSLEYLTLLLLPIMVLCLFAGDQIIEIFYGRGNFGEREIILTYGVVVGYAVGFGFQAARANLVKVYYAFQDSRRPMINGMLAILLNVVLSVLLSRFIGVSGVALATSISMLFVTCLLLRGIRKYLPEFELRHSFKEFAKGIAAVVLSGFTIIAIRYFIQVHIFLLLLIEGAATLVVYVAILALLKSDTIYVVKDQITALAKKVFNIEI